MKNEIQKSVRNHKEKFLQHMDVDTIKILDNINVVKRLQW